ncbi:MAG TPA: DUF3365 domain-containing protein, partial [Azospira sp.]|nr:DUF3365 domain-containing protein [Azospira sp.]
MRLQIKLWLGTGAVIAAVMGLDIVLGYRSVDEELRRHLDEEARIVRALLMATRRVYHQQFIASEIPLNDKTVGFLPAHALSRISQDFHHWIDTGLRFNNVSDQARNPFNQADRDELAAMDWFRHHREAEDRITVIHDPQGAAFYHFTAPIWIESYCLTCHGDKNAAPPSIRDTYSQAYGYKVGDLRGVMSIKLPMDEVRQRVLAVWWQRFWIRAGGYAILMLLLGALTQRLVTRRLARLAHGASRLEAGDLSSRVPLTGDDEVAELTSRFNRMAEAIEQHEVQIVRLNQIYAALSETNQTIVRIEDEGELIRHICHIAVTFGGMHLAWIGRAAPDHACLQVLDAFGSGTEYLDGIFLGLDPSVPEGSSPTAKAWRSNAPVIVQDYFADPATRPWQERARRYGWGAMATFPITRAGQVHLVLSLYHTERNAFDQKMVALLSEMAMDIGFALDRIDLLAQQQKLAAAIRESEEKYRAVVTGSLDGFWLMGSQGRLLEVNDAYVQFSG